MTKTELEEKLAEVEAKLKDKEDELKEKFKNYRNQEVIIKYQHVINVAFGLSLLALLAFIVV